MSNADRHSIHFETDAWVDSAVPPPLTAVQQHRQVQSGQFEGVHAHRLFRYSLRCIVEMAVQIYTSVAVHLSANVL